jgi:hypothetical protein
MSKNHENIDTSRKSVDAIDTSWAIKDGKVLHDAAA